jgi:hypothetical protein
VQLTTVRLNSATEQFDHASSQYLLLDSNDPMGQSRVMAVDLVL